MKPTDLTVQVRQRSAWEAIDLGFRLTQSHWKQIVLPLGLLLFLISVTLLLLLPREQSWLAALIMWWLKPLYDRVLLYSYSRHLFGQYPSLNDVFAALPYLIRHTGLLSALTWRRLSLSRAYNLPIWQLEKLRGKERLERQRLLHQQGHGTAIGLTIACVHLEWVLLLSLFVLPIMLDPTGHYLEYIATFFTGGATTDSHYIFDLLYHGFYALTVLMIEPFYVAAGFSLYLNRRTQLEAWDIEIAFRSIGERLGAAVRTNLSTLTAWLMLPLLLVCGTVPQQTAQAAEEYLASERLPAREAKAQIDVVMQQDELKARQQVMAWRAKDDSEEATDNPDVYSSLADIIVFFSQLLKGLLWVGLLLLIVVAILYRERILKLLKPRYKRSASPDKPQVLLGMDIRPESLPTDIAAAARELWQHGQTREALSLLYRGALMQLTHHDDLNIAASHTEGDILRLAQAPLAKPRFAYLKALTHHWQSLAYAHRPPNDEAIEQLLTDWHNFQQAASATPEAA